MNSIAFLVHLYYNICSLGGVNMKNKVLLPQNDDIFSVPFYGKRGSLKNVRIDKNDPSYYLVTRYNINGKDGDTFPVPKKRKNELYQEYIHDVKNYLDEMRTKYVTILNHSYQVDNTKKQKMFLATVMALLTIFSVFASAMATDGMLYFFLVTFFVGFVSSCFEFTSLKKSLISEKRLDEKNEYEKYLNIYNDYHIKRERSKKKHPTKYSNLEQSNDKIIDIELKRVLEKRA